MKVILTHPYCWPYVRRGTERNMDVWRRYLLDRGYCVQVLSTRPAGGQELTPDIACPAFWSPVLGRLRLQPTHTFFAGAYRALRSLDADIVHSYHFYGALAAAFARTNGRHYRTVLQMNGVPVPGVSCHRFLPPEAPLTRRAIHYSDRRIACSGFVRDLVRQHYGADADVIPPPIDISLWPVGEGPRADPPVVLGVGNFNERRKGIRVLLKAFERLKQEIADARLWISGYLSDAVRREVIDTVRDEIRPAVSLLGLGRSEDLPKLYQTASVLALPAMWEPSGTVMMEAWMCGTPVAAARHGGLPEFFADGVGFLFDPQTEGQETQNVEGLAAALYDGIRLSRDSDCRDRCRRHGTRFSSDAVGPVFENLYRELA